MSARTERRCDQHAGEPFTTRCADCAALAAEAPTEPETCDRHVWLTADGPCPKCAATSEATA